MTATERDDERAVAEALGQALADTPTTFERVAWQKLAASGWLHMLCDADPAAELARLRMPMEQWGIWLPAGPALLNVAWVLPLARMSGVQVIADEVSDGRVFTATRAATGATTDSDLVAEADGSGPRISGVARLVPWLPDADETVVSARTHTGRVIVAVVASDAPGVRVSRSTTVDAGISVGDLELDGGDAFTVVAADPTVLAAAAAVYSLALDAQAVGAAGELVAHTVRYVSERRQFGQPVGSFQAVKHKVADMLTETEAARALFWHVADQLAQRPLDPPWEEIEASRVFAGDAARKVAADAIQCFGGMGFTWEQGIHLYYRRALVAGSLLGNVEAANRRLVRHGLNHAKEQA